MSRIEIVSKSTGIHLGHVFEDGPNRHYKRMEIPAILEFYGISKEIKLEVLIARCTQYSIM
jgi:peptide methionine sulfoxide reductase MsrB